jgi:hypothetical protein
VSPGSAHVLSMRIGAGRPRGGGRQRRRRRVPQATHPRPMATRVRLAGSGALATVGGVTNVSKVVISAPTLKEVNWEKLVLVMITSPLFESVSNSPEFDISSPVRPVNPVAILARTLPLLSNL